MVKRISALRGHVTLGKFGDLTTIGPQVTLSEMPNLSLHQVALWPQTLSQGSQWLADVTRTGSVPKPGQVVQKDGVSLLRAEPLKFWVIGADTAMAEKLAGITADQGMYLDQSHARTAIRLSGAKAAETLNRFMPLDLRESAFPIDSVATSTLHHVGATLHRHETGYDLYVARGYAVGVWEVLVETAAQFGGEVV